MTLARQYQVRSAWLLSALFALGCGIAQRTVEELEVDASNGGTDSGGASSGTTKGGRAAGGQAGKGASSHGGANSGSAAAPSSAAGDAADEIGLELDFVPVGNPPAPPCSCGEGCKSPACEARTVGTAGAFLMNVFLRGPHGYVMSREQLASVPLNGATAPLGGVPSVVASELQFPSRVVVDSDFAYFTSYLGLWKVPRLAQNATLSGGGEAKLLTTLEQWKRRLTEITLDTRHVYWTNPVTEQLPARLTRTSIRDGKSVVLARLENDDDWPLGIAVDDTDVYFTSNARLLRIPKAGGDLQELQRIGAQVSYDQIHPTLSIALDEHWVYYDAGNELRRLSKADGTSAPLFIVPLNDAISGVVVDEYYVYFGTRSGSIYRLEKVEGIARVMVTGELNPLVSAVSEDAVYWVEQDASRVRSVTK